MESALTDLHFACQNQLLSKQYTMRYLSPEGMKVWATGMSVGATFSGDLSCRKEVAGTACSYHGKKCPPVSLQDRRISRQ
jgi:dienelactone hydrolase